MKRPRVHILKKWFDENREELPSVYELAGGQVIMDMDKFIASHFSFLESDKAKGNVAYIPYYDRLYEIYSKLK